MSEYKMQWKGKYLEDCSREELLACLNYQGGFWNVQNQYHESSTLKELRQELKIKDEIIDRLCRRD